MKKSPKKPTKKRGPSKRRDGSVTSLPKRGSGDRGNQHTGGKPANAGLAKSGKSANALLAKPHINQADAAHNIKPANAGLISQADAAKKMRPISKAQVEILITSVAGASPSHRDAIMTYAIRYLNLLSGPLTDDDIKAAYSIALDKFLIDLGIPENLWNHRCDPYRYSTHEIAGCHPTENRWRVQR